MTQYNVEITGRGIVDKHTHYEAYPSVGLQRATVLIRGDIATGFQKKYAISITRAKKIWVMVDLTANDQRVKECQDIFKPASHLMGSIDSLDDVFLLEL